jgi:hypothetical protein
VKAPPDNAQSLLARETPGEAELAGLRLEMDAAMAAGQGALIATSAA